jgi:K+/H+ antiporter YhaU regulatory subunit KhtT
MSKTLRLNTRVSVVGIERVGSEQLDPGGRE